MMEKNQRWRELCALAAVEQDPEKLVALVAEITRLYEEEKATPDKNSDASKEPGQDTSPQTASPQTK